MPLKSFLVTAIDPPFLFARCQCFDQRKPSVLRRLSIKKEPLNTSVQWLWATWLLALCRAVLLAYMSCSKRRFSRFAFVRSFCRRNISPECCSLYSVFGSFITPAFDFMILSAALQYSFQNYCFVFKKLS